MDIVRIQDSPVAGAEDPKVLAWCADQQRILLTHDARTIPAYAYERIEIGEAMTGVFIISDQLAVGQVIEDLIVTIEASDHEDWQNIVFYFPL